MHPFTVHCARSIRCAHNTLYSFSERQNACAVFEERFSNREANAASSSGYDATFALSCSNLNPGLASLWAGRLPSASQAKGDFGAEMGICP
jgi:hypothetical protein